MHRIVCASPFSPFRSATVVYGRHVFQRLGHALLILALIGATGTHWALLQSVAWTTMLADNLRATSLSEAVRRTFDGKHPCNICEHVAAGRKAEKKSEFPTWAKKLEYLSERPVFIFSAPKDFRTLPIFDDLARVLPHRPPVPPPRRLAA
jgi:hypothetical protein